MAQSSTGGLSFLRRRIGEQRDLFETGAELFASASPEQLTNLSSYLQRLASDPGKFDADELARQLAVQEHQARALAAVATLLTVTGEDDSDSDIVNVFSDAHIAPARFQEAISVFRSCFKPGALEFERETGRAAAAEWVLPSFDDINFVVDLRPVLEGDQYYPVPVIMSYLKTDITGERLWFQLSKSQLLRLKKKVDEAAERVTQFERFDLIERK